MEDSTYSTNHTLINYNTELNWTQTSTGTPTGLAAIHCTRVQQALCVLTAIDPSQHYIFKQELTFHLLPDIFHHSTGGRHQCYSHKFSVVLMFWLIGVYLLFSIMYVNIIQ